MTDLEHYRPHPDGVALAAHANIDPTGGRLVAWAQAAGAAHQLAQSLSKTSFIPRAFQGNPADATAAVMLGDELGLSPISALRSIYIIAGTPAMYARTMVALAMSHGHEVWTESSTDREVVVCGQRRGSQHVERAVWTIDRARKAGYTNNKKYESTPQEMLYAKAAAEIARKIAPDVLSGVPMSVEDLELEPENQPRTPVSRSTSRVARTPKPQPPEPEFDEPPPTPEQPAQVVAERADGPEPDSITAAQLKKLHASLGDAGLSDRDKGLAYISEVVGRTVTSSKELTKSEASQVIEALNPEPPEPPLDGM